MRALSPVPSSVLDPATGTARVGSYRGGLPKVDVLGAAPSTFTRLLRRKRWIYVGIASDDVYVGLGIVRLGYAANAFCYVYDAHEGKMLFDHSAIAPRGRASVDDGGPRARAARFSLGKSRLVFEQRGATATLDVAMPDLEIAAKLDATHAPPSLGAVADLGGGCVDATEKSVLLAVTGDLKVRGDGRSLDGALGGFDYTHGLLPRRTHWRWAFFMGRAKSGERIALNLVEGFTGAVECAVWIDDELYAVDEGRFDFAPKRPLERWAIRSADGAVDVALSPGAMHAETSNLGLVRARFIQPVGAFTGTIRVPGRAELTVDRVLGVGEDQDVVW